MEIAIWYPYWYELDQSIEIGITAEFTFFINPPDYIDDQDLMVFFHGGGKDRDQYYSAFKRILTIRHRELGEIKKIDASGFDYTITLLDDTVYKVEAEETPGLVYDYPNKITDWRIYVEMEAP